MITAHARAGSKKTKDRFGFVATVALALSAPGQPVGRCAEKAEDTSIELPEFRIPELPDVTAKVKGREIPGKEIKLETVKWLERQKSSMVARLKQLSGKRRRATARKMILETQKKLERIPWLILKSKIEGLLTEEYITSNNIRPTDTDIVGVERDMAAQAKKQGISPEKFKERYDFDDDKVRTIAASRRLNAEATSTKKIDALIAAHPDYFNGTSVTASHILIKCDPVAGTRTQLDCLRRLQDIAREIKSGKSKFGKTAKEVSDCPSGKRGGLLGDFTFSKMVPPFSVAAFSAKPGDITGPIKTGFGYHLIKVITRKEGTDEIDPSDAKVRNTAAKILQSQLKMKIYRQVFYNCPIEVYIKTGE